MRNIRHHHRDQLPRQQDDENRDRPRGFQRQRRKTHVNAENDPIKDIETIIRGILCRQEAQKCSKNCTSEAKDPPMTSYLVSNTFVGLAPLHQ